MARIIPAWEMRVVVASVIFCIDIYTNFLRQHTDRFPENSEDMSKLKHLSTQVRFRFSGWGQISVLVAKCYSTNPGGVLVMGLRGL